MSSQIQQTEIDIAAVNGGAAERSGVRHGAELLAFTEAVMANSTEAMVQTRNALRAVLTDEEFVDVAAIIGAFNVVTRIADATGIPLDPMIRELSAEVRSDLDLGRFSSAANTPEA